MKRGLTLAIVLFSTLCGLAGARRVAISCSLNRFVWYYQQVSGAPTPTTFWERVAASVVLTRASSKQELALN